VQLQEGLKNDTGYSPSEAFKDYRGCSVVGKNLLGLVQYCGNVFIDFKNMRQQASSNFQ